MSASAFTFDHVHLVSADPHAAAAWYEEHFGAEITADTMARGAPQIFLSLGGAVLLIRGERPGETPKPAPGFQDRGDFSSHNRWGVDHFGFLYEGDLAAFCTKLEADGVQLSVPLKSGVGGLKLCFVEGPDGVNIELMQRCSSLS
ncbi:VOC family protein [Alphaproteobacteria bacterium]|nr:VOC family protein [Alphaproteobacteria bacterium]